MGLERSMPWIRSELGRVVLEAALAPSRACIDAYEVGIRVVSDLQLTLARAVRIEPVRSVAATCANLTRDIGAAQLSTVRWFLDA
jgi:hypothetical protein